MIGPVILTTYGDCFIRRHGCGYEYPPETVQMMRMPGMDYYGDRENQNRGSAFYQDAEHRRRIAGESLSADRAKIVMRTLILHALLDAEQVSSWSIDPADEEPELRLQGQ